MTNQGIVFWLTGLSGSGKSTIASKLVDELRESKMPVVYLDGDELREIFQDQFGHSENERLRASKSYARLCAMLSAQGINVICSTISLFHETQQWNRANIGNYCEVFVRVPIEVLQKRDSKQIYSRAARGELTEVVGVDIDPQFPKSPDVIIDNYGDMTPELAAEIIFKHFKKGIIYAVS